MYIIPKIALISDSHFGWKADSLIFQDYFKRFFHTVFFPTLKQRNIKTVIHLGDFFDRRKFINFHILNRTRREILEPLNEFDTRFLIGNHDCPFRDTNSVNSVSELLGSYPNFTIHEEPEEITLGTLRILLLPWLNPMNTAPALDFIKRSTASVVMGHLELAGFHYDRMTLCDHGLDRNLFKKFKRVFSGHFHTRSQEGNIQYLGAPYELTFADCGDVRGFHIFDTETLELEFIENPFHMFYKIMYDGGSNVVEDFSTYEGAQIRVSVNQKPDPYLYDQWLGKLEEANPDNLQIVETFSLDVDEAAEEQFGDFEKGEMISTSTLEVLYKYIENMGMDLDKSKMKDLMKNLYAVATQGNG